MTTVAQVSGLSSMLAPMLLIIHIDSMVSKRSHWDEKQSATILCVSSHTLMIETHLCIQANIVLIIRDDDWISSVDNVDFALSSEVVDFVGIPQHNVCGGSPNGDKENNDFGEYSCGVAHEGNTDQVLHLRWASSWRWDFDQFTDSFMSSRVPLLTALGSSLVESSSGPNIQDTS
jgi:hypothetical protein